MLVSYSQPSPGANGRGTRASRRTNSSPVRSGVSGPGWTPSASIARRAGVSSMPTPQPDVKVSRWRTVAVPGSSGT